MREILFRGKTIGSNEWIYGGYYRVGHNCFIADSKGVCYMVEPDTISQYTGLIDCRDNKIFEGDIVSVRYLNAKAIVKWPDLEAKFVCKFTNGAYDFWYLRGEILNVIGNKWDNKELL